MPERGAGCRARCPPPRNATPGRSWPASAGSDRSASGPCSGATGARSRSCARPHPRADRRAWRRPPATSEGGRCRVTTASPRSWRPGSPRADPVGRRDARTDPRARPHDRDPRRPHVPDAPRRDRHAAARALRARRSGGPRHRRRGRDRRDAAGDRSRTSRRRPPRREPRGGRGMRRVGARGRHRWRGPRRDAPRRRHDRRGHRVRPRDHPSARP